MAENDSAQSPVTGASLIGASPKSILAFAARTIAWCIPMFALWLVAAQPISMAAAWGAEKLLDRMAPVRQTRIEWRDGRVAFLAQPDTTTEYLNHLRPGLTFEVPIDVRRQTYGVPFFLALLLAAKSRRLAAKAAAGVAILLVLAAVGVACEAAIGLATLAPQGGGRVFSFGAASATLIALGFQLGSLIFPSVGPVVLWAGMDALRHRG